MGEQNQPNDAYHPAGHELNKQYMAGVGIDRIHYVPVPSPQWIHDQQTPDNYAEYLAENVVSEVQVDASAEASAFRLVEGSGDMISQEIKYPRPYYEGMPLNCLTGSEHQLGALTWVRRGDVIHASGSCSEASTAGLSYPPKRSRKARAALSDRRVGRRGGAGRDHPPRVLNHHYVSCYMQMGWMEKCWWRMPTVGGVGRRWQSYFYRLLNDEGDKGFVLEDLEHSERCCDYGYCRRITVEEVKGAILRCGGVGRLGQTRFRWILEEH
ncbi:putative adenylate isopentenyltransferase 3, chloroplastic-like [Capsicum annuum]|nr:putative adenylate isopentenyltransferase 3, chloroplastic-like [Capsicum annuum]